MKNSLQKAWAIFSKPSVHLSFGLLTVGGFIAGIIFWGGFNTALEATNTEEFCISCHEMSDNVYVEMQQTAHWKNTSGVRATCPDCHVPHNWTDKIARKMQASKEVFGMVFGTIDTREKFLAKREELAMHEWDRFSANNSLECRNCHDYDSMDFDSMSDKAKVQMPMAAEKNQSCMDCHKGIAHELPESMAFLTASLEDFASSDYQAGQHYASVGLLPLYKDAELTQEAGQLNVASDVEILEVQGDALKIKIDAWRKVKGRGQVLNDAFGLNIRTGQLTREIAKDKAFVTRGERKRDELTGLPWQKVSVELWMANEMLTDTEDDIWQFAKSTYDLSCSACHTQPDEAHFDANTWPSMLDGMLSFANFDGETHALILKYLQKHSSDFSESEH